MSSLASLQESARVALREWTAQYLAWMEMLDSLPITDAQRRDLDFQRIRLLLVDRDHLRAVQLVDAYTDVANDTTCEICAERQPETGAKVCDFCEGWLIPHDDMLVEEAIEEARQS